VRRPRVDVTQWSGSIGPRGTIARAPRAGVNSSGKGYLYGLTHTGPLVGLRMAY